ncbi:DUF4249 family protein [candidate division KSB1 bacterium]|nr:DUF4249 family protein [candidate division KSB1 bacterium]
MRIKNLSIYVIALMILISISCDKNPAGPEYQKEITVYGYLWAGESLNADHAILISYTRPVDEKYSLNDAIPENANVTLKDESTGEVVQLNDSPDSPGFFYNDSLIIKPQTNYTLTVEADGKTVTASTTVPPALAIETDLMTNNMNYVYRDNLGINKPVTLRGENEKQIIYVDMYCNESWQNAEFIDNFGPHDKSEDSERYDQGRNAEPRHIQAFMQLKDLKTDFYPGEYVVFWYHSMIVFYGSNTMQILAIDENYHNFLHKEHPELSGGVVGGIGVFGSVCGEDFDFMVM